MHNKKLTSIDEMIPLIEERIKSGGKVSFTPMGISMYPMLRNGLDRVVLSPKSDKLKKYDVILYRRDNGQYILHRIIRTGESFTCIGDNQYKKEKGIRDDQIIALVTSFTRKGREYGVNEFGYKIYCRLWHYTRLPRKLLRSLKRRLKGGKANGQ